MRGFSFTNVARTGTRTTPVIFRQAQIRNQREVRVGWIYEVKADSNSCKRA
jgi:hypothetical protein